MREASTGWQLRGGGRCPRRRPSSPWRPTPPTLTPFRSPWPWPRSSWRPKARTYLSGAVSDTQRAAFNPKRLHYVSTWLSGSSSKPTCLDVALPVQSCVLLLVWRACLRSGGVTVEFRRNMSFLNCLFFVCVCLRKRNYCPKYLVLPLLAFRNCLSSPEHFDLIERLHRKFLDLHKALQGRSSDSLFIPAPSPRFHSFARASEAKRSQSSQCGSCQLYPRSRSLLSSAKKNSAFSYVFFCVFHVSL